MKRTPWVEVTRGQETPENAEKLSGELSGGDTVLPDANAGEERGEAVTSWSKAKNNS